MLIIGNSHFLRRRLREFIRACLLEKRFVLENLSNVESFHTKKLENRNDSSNFKKLNRDRLSPIHISSHTKHCRKWWNKMCVGAHLFNEISPPMRYITFRLQLVTSRCEMRALRIKCQIRKLVRVQSIIQRNEQREMRMRRSRTWWCYECFYYLASGTKYV